MASRKFSKFRVQSPVEFIAAFVAIVIFIGFGSYMFFSVKKNAVSVEVNSYRARFNDIDGISIGSDVKLAGYKVGSVENIKVVEDSYDVLINFTVAKNIKIPTDTTVAVRTSGLLGGKFIAILPGAEDVFLNNGDEVIYTQSAINLETLIGTFVNK